MKKPELTVVIGRESTSEELDFINQVFSSDFDVEIKGDLTRLSADDLPMIVMINILTSLSSCAIYDLLKIVAKRILGSKKIKRKTSIVIQEEDVQYILGENYVSIRKQAKDTKFDSIDDLFEFLKKEK